MTYSKPHLSYQQQLDLMKSRGVSCADDEAAIRALSANGYYNVSGYVYPFRLPNPEGGRFDEVRPGTSFEDIVKLIRFDRRLRASLLTGIQLVEVGVRAKIAYVLGARDPFGHLHRESLDNAATRKTRLVSGCEMTAFDAWVEKYEALQENAKTEPYFIHNCDKYDLPLPVWIACEFFDFGAVTRLYSLLLHEDRQTIAAAAGLRQERTLQSWLAALNDVRNICAHNGRLWNRVLLKKPQVKPADLPSDLQFLTGLPTEKVFTVIVITAWLTSHLCPDENWADSARTMLRKFPVISSVSVSDVGVPDKWDQSTIWKRADSSAR